MNTIGTAMANTTIYGGNFKDVLKSGRDSLRDKDNLKSIAVSTLGAGITSGLLKYIDGASGGIISKGAMEGASFKDKAFSALLENGLSNSVNVALESSINGDSFKESLKRQGLNMLSGTIETLGASYIGDNYHNNEFGDNKAINKATQLTLHAGLGAITSKISGGDYLSGAVSEVVGEFVGELVFNKLNENSASKSGVFTIDQFNQNKETATNIAGLFSGLSSIVASKSQGKDIEDITTNAYVGQRIGQNVAKYNSTNVVPVLDDKGNTVKDKYRVISADKDGDRSIYNMASGGEKIGNTLYDNDYVDKEGNVINFDKEYTTINLDTEKSETFSMNEIMGSDGLYGDNAELMIVHLSSFEGNKDNIYVNSEKYLTTGIGTMFDNKDKNSSIPSNRLFDLELENNGIKYSGDDLIPVYKEFKNIVNNYGVFGAIKINEQLANTGYQITLEIIMI